MHLDRAPECVRANFSTIPCHGPWWSRVQVRQYASRNVPGQRETPFVEIMASKSHDWFGQAVLSGAIVESNPRAQGQSWASRRTSTRHADLTTAKTSAPRLRVALCRGVPKPQISRTAKGQRRAEIRLMPVPFFSQLPERRSQQLHSTLAGSTARSDGRGLASGRDTASYWDGRLFCP